MAYAAVGGRIGAEPTIRFSDQKGLDTKTSTLTLQDARLLCDKRMVYTTVGEGLKAKSVIRLSDRKDSIQKRVPRLCRMPDCHATSAWHMLRSEGDGYKNGHPDFAGCPIAMRQAHGLYCGLRGSIH